MFELPRNEPEHSVSFLTSGLAVFFVFPITVDGDPEVLFLLYRLQWFATYVVAFYSLTRYAVPYVWWC